MDEVVADCDLPVARSVGATVGAPSSAVGDLAQLFDVHVRQFAWAPAFVAHRGGLRCTDDVAGDRVTLVQARYAVAAQDAGDGPGRNSDSGPEDI